MIHSNLLAVGDISFGDSYACSSIGLNSFLRKNPDHDVFKNVKDIIRSSDISFGNLETVLSKSGLRRSNLHSMHMRGSPENVSKIVDAGFNVLNVANNHVLQHGTDAFRETVDILQKNNIGIVGLAKENGRNCIPCQTKLGDTECVFLSYGFEQDKYHKSTTLYAQADEQTILEDIKTYKENDNFVICSFHWGKEFISYPGIDQVHFARKAIEHGCDLILGHHPHVLNTYEVWNDRLIFYSLGNFLFDHFWNPDCTEGCIVQLDCNNIHFYLKNLFLTNITTEFMIDIHDSQDEAVKRFQDLYKRFQYMLETEGAYYEQERLKLERKNRYAGWLFMLKNFFRYNPSLRRQIISDTLSKKIKIKK